MTIHSDSGCRFVPHCQGRKLPWSVTVFDEPDRRVAAPSKLGEDLVSIVEDIADVDGMKAARDVAVIALLVGRLLMLGI